MLSKPNERSIKMKKLLISVLVAATVLGIFGTSLGAFTDTAGTKYSEAATVLSGLGLLKGYEDGTFKPANTITRAEFSAVAVRALGLESAAAVSAVATKFSDVPATHWAAGYINICADQGIIKGYADGTFKPEAPVTYAEVLAMLVRLLGYDPSVTGTWPTNYIVKAYDIGLAGGVTFAAGSPATRGDVALFVQKSLTLPLMKQVWTGAIVSYAIDGDSSLLGEKLGYDTFTDYVDDFYTLFGSNLEENQVSLDGWWFDIGESVDFPAAWYGQLVKVWYDGTDTIVAAVNKTAASDIVTGYYLDDDASITLIVGGKEKTYDDDSWIYAQNNVWDVEPLCDSTGDPMAGDGDTVRVVLDDGWVVSIVGWTYDESALLTKVDTKYNKLAGFNSDGSGFVCDLDDFDVVVLEKDGKATDIKGLAVGDLLYYVNGGTTFWGVVSNTKVTGKVESIDTDADDTTVTIGGKAYTLADPMTFSTDNNQTVTLFALEGDLAEFDGVTATLYLDAAGDIRHMSTEAAAGIAAIKAVMKSDLFGTDNPDPEEVDHYYVRLFKLDGSSVKLEIDADDAVFTDILGTEFELGEFELLGGVEVFDTYFPLGALVSYKVKDDLLISLTALVPFSDDDDFSIDPIVDEDYNVFFTGAGPVEGFRASSSTLFIDYTNWKIRKWNDFKEISVDNGPVLPVDVFTNAGGTAGVYVLYPATSDPSDPDADFGISYGTKSENAGVVVGRQTTADGVKVKVLLADGKIVGYYADDAYDDGTIVSLEGLNEGADSDEYYDLNSGDYVTFKVNGDTYIEITEPWLDTAYWDPDDPLDLDPNESVFLYTGYVGEWDAEDLTMLVTGDPEAFDPDDDLTYETRIMALECVVYKITGSAPAVGDYEDVAADQIVNLFDVDGDGYVDVIVIAE